jgi:hypothetical protein
VNRDQLAHLLRAACDVTGDPDTLVIGSQSILATHDEDELPAPATGSIETDIAFPVAVLPTARRDRLVRWQSTATGNAMPVFIDKHDLVVSKLVAVREKDVAFASARIEAG